MAIGNLQKMVLKTAGKVLGYSPLTFAQHATKDYTE